MTAQQEQAADADRLRISVDTAPHTPDESGPAHIAVDPGAILVGPGEHHVADRGDVLRVQAGGAVLARNGSTVFAESGSKIIAYSGSTIYLLDDQNIDLRAHDAAIVHGPRDAPPSPHSTH